MPHMILFILHMLIIVIGMGTFGGWVISLLEEENAWQD